MDRSLRVVEALKAIGMDPREGVYTFDDATLRAERERRLRGGGGDAAAAAAAAATTSKLRHVANSKQAMACSRAKNCYLMCWEYPLAAYKPIVAELKRRSVINQAYVVEGKKAPANSAMIPPSTYRAMTKSFASVCEDEVEERYESLPRRLRDAMYPFQVEGVKFALSRNGRCLLADQMGVGKTIQALAVGAAYLHEGPLLIIAPASLRLTWARECERWIPELRPKNLHVINGTSDTKLRGERGDLFASLKATAAARAAYSAGSNGDEPKPTRFQRYDDEIDDDERDDDDGDDAYFAALATQVATKAMKTAAAAAFAPRVVVASYHMVARLRDKFRSVRWGAVVVDESHTLRTTTGRGEVDHTEVTLDIIRSTKRAVLATGTPSLSRPYDVFNQVDALQPGCLGSDKHEFASTYCERQWVADNPYSGTSHLSVSGGERLFELNVLLRHAVMIRRMKKDVVGDLPPKRRQVVLIDCEGLDGKRAGGAGKKTHGASQEEEEEEEEEDELDELDVIEPLAPDEERRSGSGAAGGRGGGRGAAAGGEAKKSKAQAVALQKLAGCCDWLREHLGLRRDANANASADADDIAEAERARVVIFAHHKEVLDAIQREVLDPLGVVPATGADAAAAGAHARFLPSFVRIDGSTPNAERGEAVDRFRDDERCVAALISIKAGGTGLEFQKASVVVFAELPESAADVEQAEDRVHRRGQKGSVNVYFLVAHGSALARIDDARWNSIERSLNRVRQAVDAEEAADAKGLKPDAIGADSLLPEPGVGEGMEAREGMEYAWGTLEDPVETRPERDGEGEIQSQGDDGGDSALALPPPPSDLWFELSPHTGRVHLHSREDGSAPRGESFAQNDVRRIAAVIADAIKGSTRLGVPPAVAVSDAADDDALPPSLRNDPPAILAAWTFVREIDALYAADKNRLSQAHVATRSPVNDTLGAMSIESKNGGGGGGGAAGEGKSTTRHGDGKRKPMPENAEWRPVAVRCGRTGRDVEERLEPVSGSGEPLCLQCMRVRAAPAAVAVVAVAAAAPTKATPALAHATAKAAVLSCKADLYCSRECFDIDSQTKSASKLRRALYERERGVCRLCGWDASACVKRIAVMRSRAKRREAILEDCPAFGEKGGKALLDRLVMTAWEGSAWHFDHVVAVYEGGGECTVDNGRTLCVLCHKKHSASQKKRWAAERQKRRKEEEARREEEERKAKVARGMKFIAEATAKITKKNLRDCGIVSSDEDENDVDEGAKAAAKAAPPPREPQPEPDPEICDYAGGTELFDPADEDEEDEDEDEDFENMDEDFENIMPTQAAPAAATIGRKKVKR